MRLLSAVLSAVLVIVGGLAALPAVAQAPQPTDSESPSEPVTRTTPGATETPAPSASPSPAPAPTTQPSPVPGPTTEPSPAATPTTEPSPTASAVPTDPVDADATAEPTADRTPETGPAAPTPTGTTRPERETGTDDIPRDATSKPDQAHDDDAGVQTLTAVDTACPSSGGSGGGVAGGFEIDGNCGAGGALDWDSPEVPLQPLLVDELDDCTQYTNGASEADWPTWNGAGCGVASGQADIDEVHAWGDVVDGHLWAFFGFTRVPTTGSIGYTVELNQSANQAAGVPDRTTGDLRFNLEQSGNSVPRLAAVDEWNDTTGVWAPAGAGPNGYIAGMHDSRQFVEAAFDLTALLGTVPSCPPATAFATLNLRSRQSPSLTSAIKDHASVRFETPSTCAALRATKNVDVVSGDTDPWGPFEFTLAGPVGTDAFTLDSSDPSAVFGAIVPGETYTIAEVAWPSGWEPGELACAGVTDSDSDPLSVTFTAPAGDGGAGTIEVDCAITNTRIVYDDLSVAKDATPSFDRDYDWTITKEVEGADTAEVAEGESVAFDYLVDADPSAPIDHDHQVDGTITITNPNDVAVTGVTVTDAITGASCGVTTGFDGTLDPGETIALDYTCTYPDGSSPTTGTNRVTVTWDGLYGTSGTATASADFDFGSVQPTTVSDQEVTIVDDMATPGDTGDDISWTVDVDSHDPVARQLTVTGVAGSCVEFTNTATISEGDATPDDDAPSDGATVEVCTGSDVAVSKNVVLGFDRTHQWSIGKEADTTQVTVDPDTGVATVDYTVTVTAGEAADSNWTMSGEITVTNPNDWQDVTLAGITDVVDVGGGAACTVDTAPGMTIPPGDEVTYPYTCMFDDEPAHDGTNTASVTWDAEAHATPTGTASGTADFTADDWVRSDIDETITVVDDMTDPANPVTLGAVTWTEAGAVSIFEYSLDLVAPEGTCREHANTATISETGQAAQETVVVCNEDDVVVTTTAVATFDRTYQWDVAKVVNRTRAEVGEGELATFDYTVSATPDGYVDAEHEVAGTITVTNPNDFTDVTVDVTDEVDIAGVTCTVTDGEDVVVPASGAATIDYTCTGTPAEAAYTGGTTTAMVTWDGGEATGDAAVTYEVDGETDETVDVYDDKVAQEAPGERLGTANWNPADTPTRFGYSLQLAAPAGECVDHTNTALVDVTAEEDGPAAILPVLLDTSVIGGPEDLVAASTVTVCAHADLEVARTGTGSFDRTYLWDIAKRADAVKLELGPEDTSNVTYVVDVTPGAYVDDNWSLSGTISVTNPNTFTDVRASVDDVSDVGGGVTCTVGEGSAIMVPAGETVRLDYGCTFTATPDAYEGTNTTTVRWTGPGGASSREAASPVTFDLVGETNRVVTIVDDMVADPLGEAIWNADGTPTTFTYTVPIGAPADGCDTVTNTATVEQTGQAASDDVERCRKAAQLAVENPRLPHTGADINLLGGFALGLILLGAGARVLGRRSSSG